LAVRWVGDWEQFKEGAAFGVHDDALYEDPYNLD
jgi:hypothetical protein